ncbi:MAG: hypothetical protein SFH39_11205 [Candidatus Magnetobacterium sp. LHC-1]|uniref:Uncharacterized protein n=1 Tax=Candidatus Magnetobacterium casense TaxID=1455061 RepID=A0ABS6RYE2_9BACT|nr:hypothetical protein [Candidatus Magnetobacterium casensis]MBF0607676.1 hypothetical protein [Nitrospirota bacterium]MBV6340818.1 hypothetical protein [Candidatus Magnetobacterium casensis]
MSKESPEKTPEKAPERGQDKPAPERAQTERRMPDKRQPERWSPRADHSTQKKYIALMQTILAMENRLTWTEFAYLVLNIGILFFSIALLAYVTDKTDVHIIYISSLFFIVIGEFTCLYWIISSMKIQMKLKLRYFQARYMERKQGLRDEAFFTDESSYFNPAVGYLESPDNRERVDYPKAGATRMDGFAGSAKPRHLSWAMVTVLFFIYIVLMVFVLLQMFRVL